MKIYCCECHKRVNARLTTGEEIYPHKKNLANLPFWICDKCGNYVGCHHKTEHRTKPLGAIPNKIVRKYRIKIHLNLDALWKNGHYSRQEIYNLLSRKIGHPYHTANIRTKDEAEMIIGILNAL